MKKLILLGILFLAGAGIASADGLSISFGFGNDRCYRPRRVYQRPVVYYYDGCPSYGYYKPGYYDYYPYRRAGYYDGDCYAPRRRVVIYRGCD